MCLQVRLQPRLGGRRPPLLKQLCAASPGPAEWLPSVTETPDSERKGWRPRFYQELPSRTPRCSLHEEAAPSFVPELGPFLRQIQTLAGEIGSAKDLGGLSPGQNLIEPRVVLSLMDRFTGQ